MKAVEYFDLANKYLWVEFTNAVFKRKSKHFAHLSCHIRIHNLLRQRKYLTSKLRIRDFISYRLCTIVNQCIFFSDANLKANCKYHYEGQE